MPQPSATTPVPNWPGGYFCPCHGSKYDLIGRVYRGVPAPYNLPVPPYHFPTPTSVRIGENPAGETFDLDSVVQIGIRPAAGARERQKPEDRHAERCTSAASRQRRSRLIDIKVGRPISFYTGQMGRRSWPIEGSFTAAIEGGS